MKLRAALCLPPLMLALLAGCEKAAGPAESGKRAAASAAGQAAPMVTALVPGLWETTSTIGMIDAAERAALETPEALKLADELGGQQKKAAMCLSPDQARSPHAKVIAGQVEGQCSFESFSLYKGTLDAVLTCAVPGKKGRTLIAAHGNYQGKAFALDAVLRLEPDMPFDTGKGPMPSTQSPPVRFHTKIVGTYKGECPAGEDVAQ